MNYVCFLILYNFFFRSFISFLKPSQRKKRSKHKSTVAPEGSTPPPPPSPPPPTVLDDDNLPSPSPSPSPSPHEHIEEEEEDDEERHSEDYYSDSSRASPNPPSINGDSPREERPSSLTPTPSRSASPSPERVVQPSQKATLALLASISFQ